MNVNRQDSDRERLLELLADRATDVLSAAETAEIEKLMAQFPDVDPEQFERLAAAADLAWQGGGQSALPPALRKSIAAEVKQRMQLDAAVRVENQLSRPASPAASVSRWLPWLAVAASLALALAGWWPKLVGPAAPQLLADREKLLASPDIVTAKLDATSPEVPTGGDVVWSVADQRGYLRLRALPPNDPRKMQYQLWIFDKDQDERYPVDGGVFNVTGNGEVIVPIHAPIAVRGPVMFAITEEKPGGVVVSNREKIVLLGKVAAR
jgi:hypothetical protein